MLSKHIDVVPGDTVYEPYRFFTGSISISKKDLRRWRRMMRGKFGANAKEGREIEARWKRARESYRDLMEGPVKYAVKLARQTEEALKRRSPRKIVLMEMVLERESEQ